MSGGGFKPPNPPCIYAPVANNNKCSLFYNDGLSMFIRYVSKDKNLVSRYKKYYNIRVMTFI